jgi:hypothetical protein
MYFCELHVEECVMDREGFAQCGDYNLDCRCIWCVSIDMNIDPLQAAIEELKKLECFNDIVCDGILPIELIIYVDKVTEECEQMVDYIMSTAKEKLDLYYVIREEKE